MDFRVVAWRISAGAVALVDWERGIVRLISAAERAFDALKYHVAESLERRRPLLIFPYLGYGSPHFIYLKGRVLVDKGIRLASEGDSAWVNLLNMYRRFESDEIPFARVLVRFQETEQQVIADEEGFFEVSLSLAKPLPKGALWQEIDLELIEPQPWDGMPVRAQGRVRIVAPQSEFGVISDIDDTVVYTGVTSRLQMARTVFLRNAHTRLPLEGVAAFYQALQAGSTGFGHNPLFYVSGSPWNLYDLFTQFFEINEIPAGPLIFRDWGLSQDSFLSIRHSHFKLNAIRRILESYPALPFILIGDSGEEDPEIYAEVAQDYPGRILAVYIHVVQRVGRKVTHDRRSELLGRLAREVESLGSRMFLSAETGDMVRDAAGRGWIQLPAGF